MSALHKVNVSALQVLNAGQRLYSEYLSVMFSLFQLSTSVVSMSLVICNFIYLFIYLSIRDNYTIINHNVNVSALPCTLSLSCCTVSTSSPDAHASAFLFGVKKVAMSTSPLLFIFTSVSYKIPSDFTTVFIVIIIIIILCST